MAKFSLEKAREDSKKWDLELREKIMSNPEAKEVYDRKKREIEIALLMRSARKEARLSQEEVAKRMKTTRSAVSRMESSGVGRHSPSIDTLLKYAHALGYAVKIDLTPIEQRR
jgi:DNA-binding XRE family transcriptional regulator